LTARLIALLVLSACAAKVLLHLSLVNRYGYHGDELYFLDCGRHLAFGYVDHPPLIPWLARLADELGGSLFVLRLPAIAASAGTMLVAALLAREWGAGFHAQLLVQLSLLLAPAHLRLGAMLNIPVIEVFLCTLTAYLAARALRRGERWTWLIAGAALGLAILAKHASVLWGAALFAGILVSSERRVLATRWPWLGAAIAFAFFLPNLVWQAHNDFVTFEFMGQMRAQLLATQGRTLFAAGQLLYFHPLAAPIWLAGVAFAFTDHGRAARPFAVQFLAMFAFLLITGGKPYYIASAYPAVLCAGGLALERFFETRTLFRRTFVGAFASTGLALGAVTVPALPIQTVDATLDALLGFAVPPIALTHDLHGMHGWDEHVAVIDRVHSALPAHDRERASVLTGTYAQAAALNILGDPSMPRALSGNMTYALWGPDPARGEVLIVHSVPRALLERHYARCDDVARIDPPLARPQDRELSVLVCREPMRSRRALWSALWPELRHVGHGPSPSSARALAGFATKSP
jgi:hypothetical protein